MHIIYCSYVALTGSKKQCKRGKEGGANEAGTEKLNADLALYNATFQYLDLKLFVLNE